MKLLLRDAVLIAIQFDNQSCRPAEEIRDIGPDRLLAAEFDTAKAAVSQKCPQDALGVRHIRAKPTRRGLLQIAPAQTVRPAHDVGPLPEICFANFDPPSRGG